MTKPPVPFAPEPLGRLRDRYPLALRDTFDPESIRLRAQARPSELRRHVFDSEDGLRLIVSVEDHGGRRGAHLHVSASLVPGSTLESSLKAVARSRGGQAATEALIVAAEARFRELSGDAAPLELLGVSSAKGIPHWVRGIGVRA